MPIRRFFGSLFGRRAAARDVPTRGHRGIAAGSLLPGEQDLSPENIARWKTLSQGEVGGFLYAGDILFVHSTNVAAAQYQRGSEQLMVEYKDGSAYLYQDVSLSEARQFAQASSKGGAVWDLLRLRGTVKGYKKKYRRIR